MNKAKRSNEKGIGEYGGTDERREGERGGDGYLIYVGNGREWQ